MPTYEYRCEKCGNQYEKREGFDAPALQICPNCGGSARRVIYAPPILFKGSGFYVTDSRQSAPEAESAAKVESTAKVESAPAEKTEAPAPASSGKDAEPAAAS